MTNREFMTNNIEFINACRALKETPTPNKAAKFRKCRGTIFECLSKSKQKDLKHRFKKEGLLTNPAAGQFQRPEIAE